MIISGVCGKVVLITGMPVGPVCRFQSWQQWAECAHFCAPGQCMLAFILVVTARLILGPPGVLFRCW